MLHGTSCTRKARELFCLHGNTCSNHGEKKQNDDSFFFSYLVTGILVLITHTGYFQASLHHVIFTEREASTSVITQQSSALNTLSSLTQQMALTCCQSFTEFFFLVPFKEQHQAPPSYRELGTQTEPFNHDWVQLLTKRAVLVRNV